MTQRLYENDERLQKLRHAHDDADSMNLRSAIKSAIDERKESLRDRSTDKKYHE